MADTSTDQQSYNQVHTPTQELTVNSIPTTTTINKGEDNNAGPSNISKKHGGHKKTASLQMMENHTVEETLLSELWFGKFIVEWPFILCLLILFVLFIIIFIDSAYFELSDQSNRTFLVEGNKYVDSYDSFNLAAQFIADNQIDNSTTLPQTQSDDFWLYQYMFMLSDYKNDFNINSPEKTDYWILTPENIETIIKYENMIVNDIEWKSSFCYVGPNPLNTNYSCDAGIQSVARMIYNELNYSSMTTEDIKHWVYDRIDSLSFFFNPGVLETGQSYIYRSFFSAGLPIATKESETINGSTIHYTKYKNQLDNIIQQEQTYISWATQLFKDITVKNNGELIDNNLKILTVSWIVYDDYFGVLLNESMVYLIFSILIVLFYMTIHLNSLFLSICALFQILMSFPLAYFFYRLIFGIPHYDTLSSLIIFVLLGVGADDVFVFTDAWLQSIHFISKHSKLSTVYEPNCKDKYCNCSCCCSCCCGIDNNKQINILRMSFAFRRAAKAMLVTQMTTFFAFLATATSVVMPIAAFGIWAATIVAMNYILVITMYPAILIIHHKYLKKYESFCLCFCCRIISKKCKKKNINQSKNNNNNNNNDNNNDDMMPEISRQLSDDNNNNNNNTEEYRCFEQFLGRKWSKCIVKFRYIVLIFFICLFIGAAILGSQMEAQSEDEKWFADEHFMQKSMDRAQEFSASETDNLVQMLITFGIGGVNRDGTSRWDPEKYGRVIWDNTFDMSLPESQIYLLNICDETHNNSLVYPSELLTTRNTSVICPIEDFKYYLLSNSYSFPYIKNNNNDKTFEEIYYEFLNSEWGFESKSSALTFVDRIDNKYKIRFYAMYIYTSITWNLGSDLSRNERSKWDNYISQFIIGNCPNNLCNSVENVSLRWCWLVTQKAFVKSAIQGILIAMPLAFIILLLSTQNWIISIFAIFDIIGIMLCELSIMQLMGWKFGVSESVAIVIIIGFSVDYVVHLANAYLESSQNKRQERLSFALLTMGISVVSGAITTFAAGFFLIFPAIVFFYKMGILMITTVSISIIWAMCFFTSICAVIGPENDNGDLKKYFKCFPCCKNNKNNKNNKTKNKNNNSKSERKETYKNYEVNNSEIKPYEIEMEENNNNNEMEIELR